MNTLLSLIIPILFMGQNVNQSMENNQLPQEGRSSSKVAHLGRSIDQMIYGQGKYSRINPGHCTSPLYSSITTHPFWRRPVQTKTRRSHQDKLVCVTFQANKERVDFTDLARQVAAAFDNRLGSDANNNNLFIYESLYSVDETIQRIKNQLKALKIPVFAKFDHGKNAKEVNLNLRPTQVIVFGAPAVGTHLMEVNQSIAIELPLKIAVWEDKKHSVWAAFPQMDQLAEKYNMQGNPIIGKMQTLLQQLVTKAGSVY